MAERPGPRHHYFVAFLSSADGSGAGLGLHPRQSAASRRGTPPPPPMRGGRRAVTVGAARPPAPRASARGSRLLAHEMDRHAVGILGRLAECLGEGRMGVDRVRQIAHVEVGGDRE